MELGGPPQAVYLGHNPRSPGFLRKWKMPSTRILLVIFVGSMALISVATAPEDVRKAPTMLSMVIALCFTQFGLMTLFTSFSCVLTLVLHQLQRLTFGSLRIIEWQRLGESMINYTTGQLVILGAVVEPDLAEFGLWATFSLIIGALGAFSGDLLPSSPSPLCLALRPLRPPPYPPNQHPSHPRVTNPATWCPCALRAVPRSPRVSRAPTAAALPIRVRSFRHPRERHPSRHRLPLCSKPGGIFRCRALHARPLPLSGRNP